MAFSGLPVSEEARAQLSAIKVDGELQDPTTFHITALYLGKKVPVDTVMSAIRACHDFCQTQKPFEVQTSLVTSFPANPEDGIPVIAKVVSPELMKFREGLKQAVIASGVPFDDKYPEYKPHVTLAYSDNPVTDQKITPVAWTIDHMIMWCGDRSADGMTVEIPLGTSTPHTAAALRLIEAGLHLWTMK